MKLRVTVNGVSYDVDVEILEDRDLMPQVAPIPPVAPPAPRPAAPAPAPVSAPSAAPAPAPAAGARTLNSPIPGTVVEVQVKAGQHVKINDPILVLDAMKMNTQVNSNTDGVIKDLLVKSGDVVKMGQPMVVFE